MSIMKKSLKSIRYMLSGPQKKSGFNTWRYVFSGIENGTGLERKFFIELSMLNPGLSPSEPVLGFTPRAKIQPEDLQNVLAGTSSAQKLESEHLEIPSYVKISAGVLGSGAKQLSYYSSIKNTKINNRIFEVGTGHCFFSEDKLIGKLDVMMSELHEHPEYMCDSGSMSWELRYEIHQDFINGYEGKTESWFAVGSRTVFAGTITLDGKNYNVIPKKSFGYIDRHFGKEYSAPWLHLSSSNLTSIISGKTLQNASFAVQGIFNNRFSVIVDLEGHKVAFEAQNRAGAFESHWDFNQMPENNEQEKLHWTISAHNKKYVIDIDVYSIAAQMFVRTVELPEGNRKNLKMLSGGNGTGEIRLYKRIRRNLELIEHAQIAGSLCEFGQKEDAEL